MPFPAFHPNRAVCLKATSSSLMRAAVSQSSPSSLPDRTSAADHQESTRPFALKVAGVKAIVAESYARIFYRNCVDGGFAIPYETAEQLNQVIKTGDELKIDVEANTIENLTSKVTYKLNPLGDVFNIVEAGGIFAYARQENLMPQR